MFSHKKTTRIIRRDKNADGMKDFGVSPRTTLVRKRQQFANVKITAKQSEKSFQAKSAAVTSGEVISPHIPTSQRFPKAIKIAIAAASAPTILRCTIPDLSLERHGNECAAK